MSDPITPEEAAEALRLIDASRAAFRAAVGAKRGYQHLWIWGAVWATQCLYIQLAPIVHAWVPNSLCVAGIIGSLLVGRNQARAFRAPRDRRFFAALAAIIGFGVFVWPFIFLGHHPLSEQGASQTLFAYVSLIAMQCYVLAGIWFDNHLLWVGSLVSVLIVVGYVFFIAWFWWWMALFAGGTLIASGFYIRHSWK
ncbi:MAG TPA: hypothetical protein VGL42_02800 [Opitutaceae bacterium]|jgi:hypothetical protein